MRSTKNPVQKETPPSSSAKIQSKLQHNAPNSDARPKPKVDDEESYDAIEESREDAIFESEEDDSLGYSPTTSRLMKK